MKYSRMMSYCSATIVGILATVILGAGQTTQAQTGGGGSTITGSGGAAGAQGQTVNLPRCNGSLGTIALAESEIPQYAQAAGLGSPVPLVRLMILQSGCFRVVDRGRGFQQMQFERSLASGGQLKAGSNVGDGQMVAADYILTPTILSQNQNAGGLGGMLSSMSSLLPGIVGSVAGNVNLKTQKAETMLALTDTRTGVQEAIAQGSAQKSDLSIGGGFSGIGGVNLSGAGGSYENTQIGKITATAFLDAYSNLVTQVRAMMSARGAMPRQPQPQATGTQGTPPNLPNPNTVYNVVSILNVRSGPSTGSTVVSQLHPGMVVTATGKHQGSWWIVILPNNEFGWVYAKHLRLP